MPRTALAALAKVACAFDAVAVVDVRRCTDPVCSPDLGQLVDYAQRFFCCKVTAAHPHP
jgi:hypothetical protein